MSRYLAGLICTAAPIAVAAVAFRWKRNDPSWRPFLPGIVATAVGLGLSCATYVWVFADGPCADASSFTCRLNENQGIFHLLPTIVLAVLALWTTMLTRVSGIAAPLRLPPKHALRRTSKLHSKRLGTT